MKPLSLFVALALISPYQMIADDNSELFRIYQIGNSLTWDSRPIETRQALESGGLKVAQGYHIACGQNLVFIESKPDKGICVDLVPEFGNWKEALSEHAWDAITIQAYTGNSGTEQVDATCRIIEEALSGSRNSSTTFYLYLAWPMRSEAATFRGRMDRNFNGDSAEVFLSKGWLDYWHAKVQERFPELKLRVIPTGLVLAELDQRLSDQPIAGLTSANDLYRDDHHLTEEGQFVAMATMAAALSGDDPADVIPESLREKHFPEFVSLVFEVIKAVLQTTNAK